MNRAIVVLALAAVAAGCQPAAEADSGAAETSTKAAGFDFRGDFSGPLGLQLWSIQDSIAKDVSGALAWVRSMGFQEVQTAGTYGMTAAQFREELDRAGLRATAMHVDYERLRDSIDAVIADAKTLGASYVGTAWIPHEPGEPFTAELARRAAADFDRSGKAAREQGIQLFYHVHGYEFRPGPDGRTPFDVLVEETDPEAVKFEIDVFWVALPGVDPAALLRKHPGRWALMHIKDMKQGTPTDDHSGAAPAETMVPVGTGQIDYRAVLQAAREIGLARYYVEDETTDPFGNIPLSLEFLQTVRF